MRLRLSVLFVAVQVLAATPAFARALTIRVEHGDQLGKLLFCMGHRHLWAKDGAVLQAVRLNGKRLTRNAGNLIFPGMRLRVPMPSTGWEEDRIREEKVLGCVRETREARETAAEETPTSPSTETQNTTETTATPEPTVTPAPTQAAATSWGSLHPVVTAEIVSDDFDFGPGNLERFALLGLNVGLQLDWSFSERLTPFLGLKALLLSFHDDTAAGLRQLDVEGGTAIAAYRRDRWLLTVLPSLGYRTLFNLGTNAGYRNLVGFSLGLEPRWELSAQSTAIFARVFYRLMNSDQSVLGGTREWTVCAGVANRLESERWSASLCVDRLTTDFFGYPASERRIRAGFHWRL